jgi:hypothetical protein
MDRPKRCQTDIVGRRFECLSCGAGQAEACPDPGMMTVLEAQRRNRAYELGRQKYRRDHPLVTGAALERPL